ncbi:extensin family protein [Enhygromyxa salina]|nr:extensin family protein [Enhygromyxa salina]
MPGWTRSPSIVALLGATGLCACLEIEIRPLGDDGTSSDSGPTSEAGDSSDSVGDGDDGDGDDGDGDGDSGDGDSGDGDGDPSACDPTPSSWDPWIGGPCVSDLDCAYEGSACLREDEGWPCGTCSQPCEQFCPDIDGAPESFCADQALVDPFAPDSGACLQKCDPSLLPGGGCRPGYGCTLVERHADPGVWAAVCLPKEFAPPLSECQQALDDAGLLWVPAHIPLDHPDTNPELDCVIDEPVRLYSPINGIDYRYVSSEKPSPLLVSCEMALALDMLSELLQSKDAIEVAHIGTYNCRVIANTNTLSEHSFAHAIDLGGFTLEGGQYLSVLDDWEDGVAEPVTFAGQWLKDLTDQRHEQGIFNIILTPEYNAAHDNHFHVDLTPGADFYE